MWLYVKVIEISGMRNKEQQFTLTSYSSTMTASSTTFLFGITLRASAPKQCELISLATLSSFPHLVTYQYSVTPEMTS